MSPRWIYEAWDTPQTALNPIKGTVAHMAGSWGVSIPGDGTLTVNGAPTVPVRWRLEASAIDCEITTTVTRFDSVANQRLWIYLRSDKKGINAHATGEPALNGIALVIDHTGAASIVKTVNGTQTTVSAAQALLPNTDTAYNVRYRSDAGHLQAKVWAVGVSEPGSWNHDWTDDGTVPGPGSPEFVFYRDTGSARAFKLGPVTLLHATALRTSPNPAVYRKPDGSMVPYGDTYFKWQDDCNDSSTPSWITGSLTYNSSLIRRDFVVAGSSSGTVSTPAVNTAEAESIKLTLGNCSAGSSVDIDFAIQMVCSNGTTWQVRQIGGTDTSMSLSGATGESASLTYRMFDNSEHLRRRNIALQILIRQKQLLFWEGDQLVGFMPITSSISGTITPTVKLTATTATGKTVVWRQMMVEVERI